MELMEAIRSQIGYDCIADRFNRERLTRSSSSSQRFLPPRAKPLQSAATSESQVTENPAAEESAAPSQVQKERTAPDMAVLKAQNDDFAAWIQIPGTNVDYPVVVSDDTEYYLTHTFTGKESKIGTLFSLAKTDYAAPSRNIAIYGYAYAATVGETKVYGSLELAEDQHVFTIAGGQPILATACIDSETHSSVKVWFITGTGEAMTGYVSGQSLEEAPLDADGANAMEAYGSGYVDSEAGILLAFVVQGDFPQTMEETASEDAVIEDNEIPGEEENAAIEVVLPDEQEGEPIPAEPETTEEHEEIPESKQMTAEIGDFAYVTTNTRAFMEVDESAADDYYGDGLRISA